MSSGDIRKVSRQDIQLVQNLIERCLQLYMNQKEVVSTLLDQAKIEPGFTELVWQKLEEENQEFFKAYRLRLMVKQQIVIFNKLLERQVELMRQIPPSGVASMSISNVSHITMQQNSVCNTTGPALKPENMHHQINSSMHNAFLNGGPSLQPSIPTAVDISSHARRIDVQPDTLPTHSSSMGMVPVLNGVMVKSEAGYAGGHPFMFNADSAVLETRPTIGDGSVASYSSVESNSLPLNEQNLDADISSFGFLGQIPRNFSLSDLTADFSQSSDILESYPRSPFLNQGDNSRLDAIAEGMSFED